MRKFIVGVCMAAISATGVAVVAMPAGAATPAPAQSKLCKLLTGITINPSSDPTAAGGIENAKKYSPERTPVKITVWQEDGEARVAVADSGIGIPAADLPRIFERFSRASNVDDRRFHGMGLGLFICRGIVEEHGGRIWVESEVGKGSTFHVALPIADGRRLN